MHNELSNKQLISLSALMLGGVMVLIVACAITTNIFSMAMLVLWTLIGLLIYRETDRPFMFRTGFEVLAYLLLFCLMLDAGYYELIFLKP